MEAPPGIEPGMEVLQTSALPLGDGALKKVRSQKLEVRSEERSDARLLLQFVLGQQHSTSRSRLVIGVCRIRRPLLPCSVCFEIDAERSDFLPTLRRSSKNVAAKWSARPRARVTKAASRSKQAPGDK